MQVKLQSVKKLAQNKAVQLLASALAGAAAMYAYFESKTLLEISDSDARDIRASVGTAVFNTKYGPVFVGMSDPEAEPLEE